jgi:hypothetical protein
MPHRTARAFGAGFYPQSCIAGAGRGEYAEEIAGIEVNGAVEVSFEYARSREAASHRSVRVRVRPSGLLSMNVGPTVSISQRAWWRNPRVSSGCRLHQNGASTGPREAVRRGPRPATRSDPEDCPCRTTVRLWNRHRFRGGERPVTQGESGLRHRLCAARNLHVHQAIRCRIRDGRACEDCARGNEH